MGTDFITWMQGLKNALTAAGQQEAASVIQELVGNAPDAGNLDGIAKVVSDYATANPLEPGPLALPMKHTMAEDLEIPVELTLTGQAPITGTLKLGLAGKVIGCDSTLDVGPIGGGVLFGAVVAGLLAVGS